MKDIGEVIARFERLRSGETSTEIDDFRFALFGAVINGKNVEKIIKPLPVDFHIPNTQEPNLELLRECYKTLTTAPIQEALLSYRTTVLLDHILNNRRFDLSRISVEDIELGDDEKTATKMQASFEKMPCARPQYVFKLTKHGNESKEKHFQSLKQEHGSFYAFHGTQLQSVRSICDFGLVSIFNEREAFGTGVYCADRLDTALSYAPFVVNHFEGSTFGRKLSTILLVEIINHPNIADGDKHRGVPKGFYIIANADWIRVDSILLYTDVPASRASRKLLEEATNSIKKRKIAQQGDTTDKAVEGPLKVLEEDEEETALVPITKPLTERCSNWIEANSGAVCLLILFSTLFFLGTFMTRNSDP